jgi:SAM-dependent methyltransferase
MGFVNTYEDAVRAEAYAQLEFPGTYYLAFRDIPGIINEHVKGKEAVDFGCGAGRSTRFLKRLGFDVIGVDISEEMIKKAREFDPTGDYRLVENGSLGKFEKSTYDLIQSAFTFDNIPTMERKVKIFTEMAHMLDNHGKIVNLVSSPEMYINEWSSFSTRDFPENKLARSGDIVKIIGLDNLDKRPVEDIFWTDADYREVYRRSGLEIVETHKPLSSDSEPYPWVNETKIAPWVIYVLAKV